MDDERTWRLAIAALVVAVFALSVDAVTGGAVDTTGLWGFLTAFLGFLGARAVIKTRDGNGKRNGA